MKSKGIIWTVVVAAIGIGVAVFVTQFHSQQKRENLARLRCEVRSPISLSVLMQALQTRARQEGGEVRLALDLVEGTPRDKLVHRQVLDLTRVEVLERDLGEVQDAPEEELIIYEKHGDALLAAHAALSSLQAVYSDGRKSLNSLHRFVYSFPYQGRKNIQPRERWNLVFLLKEGREIAFAGTRCEEGVR